MARIEGPDGQVVKVDEDGRMHTISATQTLAQHLVFQGNTFTVNFTQTPVGADDFFLFVKNTGLDDIGIGIFTFSVSVATRITVEHVMGTPVFVSNGGAGTAVVPVNLNLGSSNILVTDIISDTNATGLTTLGVLAFDDIDTVDSTKKLTINPGFIIPQGKSFALRSSVSSAVTCQFTIGIVT